jgi:hypothetical protein
MQKRCWVAFLLIACGHTDSPSPDARAPDDLGVPADLKPLGPALLSQTGLYSDFASRTLTAGVIEYVVRYPLWSDGAEKRRLLLLPQGTQIDTSDMDNWVFPIGTKVWKEFHQDGKLVETRLLYKAQSGTSGWWKTAYVWRADGSDADATIDGIANALGTVHDVPSQDDCQTCHRNVRDVVIGVSAIQLSSPDGGALSELATAGLLTTPPAGEFTVPGNGVVQEALGYLHGNCGHCHNDGSIFAGAVKLRLRLRVGDMVPESTPTYLTAINQKTYHIINGTHYAVVPGSPDQSQLYYRMSVRDYDAMPPVCTKLSDPTGLTTIHDWITSLH